MGLQLGGYERGHLLVAPFQDLEEVDCILRGNRGGEEVVQDQELDALQVIYEAIAGGGIECPRAVEPVEHVGEAQVARGDELAACCVTQRLAQEALPAARLRYEQDHFGPSHPPAPRSALRHGPC